MPAVPGGTGDGSDELRAREARARERGWIFTVLEPGQRGSPEPQAGMSEVHEATAFVTTEAGARAHCVSGASLADLLDRVDEFDRHHGRL